MMDGVQITSRKIPKLQSANTYDSLAETYLKTGEKKLALEFYKKASEVNSNYPNHNAAREVIKKLEAELKEQFFKLKGLWQNKR